MKTTLVISKMVIVFAIALGLSSLAGAKGYPTKTIQVICAYEAGGSTSASGRIVAQSMSQILGQAIVIVNKPGGGGLIGATAAVKAKPDGYTLFVAGGGPNVVAIALNHPNLTYSNKDFKWIGQYSAGQVGMGVRADSPFKSVKDLVEYAKTHPGDLKYPGATTDTVRFATELFSMEAGGLKFERLPISGGAELNTMLLGGNAQFAIAPAADMSGLAMAGKFRFLAFANEERNKDFPDVPTFKELGYPSIVLSTFYALATQKSVPEDVLKMLRDTFAKAWEQGETKTLLKGLGHTPFYRNAEDLGTYIESQVNLYRRIAEKANIKITEGAH